MPVPLQLAGGPSCYNNCRSGAVPAGGREPLRPPAPMGFVARQASRQPPPSMRTTPGPTAHLAPHHPQAFWLWVMCLTGVDYFSTLGYQPSIAYSNAGLLAPLASVVLVLVTLFGAYPVYAFVARCSHEGQGSIGMLAGLVSGWGGKVLVLTLLGFAATDFVITKTMSAADAAKHLIENPYWPVRPEEGAAPGRQQLLVTSFLLVLLGATFIRGFKEVIGLAVGIVAVYLVLNLVVLGATVVHMTDHPRLVADWWAKVTAGDWHLSNPPLSGGGGWLFTLAVVLLVFPKLALGLSGFETGVAVMPLVRGDTADTQQNPAGRVRNTRRLLLTAALLMSGLLLVSSLAVCALIPPDALLYPHPTEPGKLLSVEAWPDGVPKPTKAPAAHERALAYLAHNEPVLGGGRLPAPLGEAFGTLYDLSTVVILWFAGASAMAGLLNLVPKYLPRYGMAPEWARAVRPLVILLTGINLLVTYLFNADVTAQGDAYATGVLVLITSACVATVIEKWRTRQGTFGGRLSWPFLLVTLVFVYTTGAILVEKTIGLYISLCFIGTILLVSFASRIARSRELRFAGFRMTDTSCKFLWDTIRHLDLTILVPHRPGRRTLAEKEAHIRKEHRIPPEQMVVFIEVGLADASDFVGDMVMEVSQEEGRYVVKVTGAASIAHTLAAVALEMAKVGEPPEVHFGWTDESPVSGTFGFLLFGEGNVPWMVRELLRKAEPDPNKRPRVIIAGA